MSRIFIPSKVFRPCGAIHQLRALLIYKNFNQSDFLDDLADSNIDIVRNLYLDPVAEYFPVLSFSACTNSPSRGSRCTGLLGAASPAPSLGRSAAEGRHLPKRIATEPGRRYVNTCTL